MYKLYKHKTGLEVESNLKRQSHGLKKTLVWLISILTLRISPFSAFSYKIITITKKMLQYYLFFVAKVQKSLESLEKV